MDVDGPLNIDGPLNADRRYLMGAMSFNLRTPETTGIGRGHRDTAHYWADAR